MALWKRDVDWVAEAAQRIGCCGLAGWLPEFASWAQLTPSACPPAAPARKAGYASVSRGLKMTLHHPFAARASSTSPAPPSDAQAWVLYELEIDAAVLPLPFGLDAGRETPQGARRKLSHDAALVACSAGERGGRRRIVHYLPDGRVVGVGFKPSLAGIEHLHLQRIVSMPDFRTMGATGAGAG